MVKHSNVYWIQAIEICLACAATFLTFKISIKDYSTQVGSIFSFEVESSYISFPSREEAALNSISHFPEQVSWNQAVQFSPKFWNCKPSWGHHPSFTKLVLWNRQLSSPDFSNYCCGQMKFDSECSWKHLPWLGDTSPISRALDYSNHW